MSLGMRRLMSLTASTKRAALTSGKYGTPATKIASLLCTPVDPVPLAEASSLPVRQTLGSPIGLYQTVVIGGQDILAGDILTAGGVDYNIRMAEPWAASTITNDAYMKLTLEKVKP
jgi:hypothetical protein